MSSIHIQGSKLSNALQELLVADDIEPGDRVSYQTCKAILTTHPLGLKMTRGPVAAALAKPRKISVPDGPEEHCVKAFNEAWRALNVDESIKNTATLARAYGVSAVTVVIDGEDASVPLDLQRLGNRDITFNVLDPLNIAGSMVANQQPNSSNFLKPSAVVCNGVAYHKSRSVTFCNEAPIYLDYSMSGFGFVGRSVYQRALYPLKTYIQTMVTDDMVVRKSGVMVAKMKLMGSIGESVMGALLGFKRRIVKEAETGNVISISTEEDIETLNMQNLDEAYNLARKNVLENIAIAADMPAKLLNQETFAEGFGEGTEDAKAVVRYLTGLRDDLAPLYEFFDRIVMYRAWNPDFYRTIQSMFPAEYGRIPYSTALYRWINSFSAEWPSLLEEPESKEIEVEKTKFETVNSVVTIFEKHMDPHNLARLLQWAADNLNENKRMFPTPLDLDMDALEAHAVEQNERQAQMGVMGGDEGASPRPALLERGNPFSIAAE